MGDRVNIATPGGDRQAQRDLSLRASLLAKGLLDLAVRDLGLETDQSLVLGPGMPVASSG